MFRNYALLLVICAALLLVGCGSDNSATDTESPDTQQEMQNDTNSDTMNKDDGVEKAMPEEKAGEGMGKEEMKQGGTEDKGMDSDTMKKDDGMMKKDDGMMKKDDSMKKDMDKTMPEKNSTEDQKTTGSNSSGNRCVKHVVLRGNRKQSTSVSCSLLLKKLFIECEFGRLCEGNS